MLVQFQALSEDASSHLTSAANTLDRQVLLCMFGAVRRRAVRHITNGVSPARSLARRFGTECQGETRPRLPLHSRELDKLEGESVTSREFPVAPVL